MSSNIVKWNYIHFDNEEKRVIDSDEKKELLTKILAVPKGAIDSAFGRQEQSEGKMMEPIEPAEDLGDSEMNETLLEEVELLKEEAKEILENAKKEAEQLVVAAQEEAASIKEAAYQVGKETGYADGMKQSEHQLIKERAKLEEERQADREEYGRLLEEAEPKFVDVMIGLIEKITGVLIESKKEVILHLVHNGIQQIGRSEKYSIYCSSEDYMMLEEGKGRLCSAIGRADGIEILEDSSFKKNQCIIETDNKILDCSLDIQLKNLIETLKLLNIEK